MPRAGVRKPKAHTRQDALEMLRDGSSNLYANVSMASAFLLSKLVKGKLHAELAGESSFRFDQVWSSKKTLVFIRPSWAHSGDLSIILLWYLIRLAENQKGSGTILIDDCVDALSLLEDPQEEFRKLTTAGKHVLFDVQNFAQLKAILGDAAAKEFIASFDNVLVSDKTSLQSIFSAMGWHVFKAGEKA